jgi:hypothetical protein
MVYPGSGIANSTGTAWGTSYSTSGSGTVVALTTSPVLTTPSLGVATATSVQQAANNGGGFLGKPVSGANDYSFFVNSSNEWELRQAVGGVFSSTFKWGVSNYYAEGAEDLGITTKGWGALWLKGSTSGEAKLVAPSTSGATNTLPAFTSTIGGRVASYDATALIAPASNQLLASAAQGFYRLSVFMICTRAAAISSTMGENTQVTYTPVGGTGGITHYIDMMPIAAVGLSSAGYASPIADVILQGSIVLYVASTAVVTYNNGYTSTGTGTTAMRYNVSVRLERID